ncbi:DUF4123 domain-containing protein [Caulobacter sp. LARHSG274]
MTEPTPQLLQEIGDLPHERFVVLDGALFNDLPRELAAVGLGGRPLYFEGADVDIIKAGPFLIRLAAYDSAQRLLNLVGDRRTGVFWSSPAGMDTLYRHLRRLNMVQIALVHEPRQDSDFQTVLFRHADPNVIATMVAVMDADQKREFLGPSPAVAYSAGSLGGVRVLRAGA